MAKTVRMPYLSRVLQCVAVCCSVLQSDAVCCRVLQSVAVCCSVLQCVAVCDSVLQCVAVCVAVCHSKPIAGFEGQVIVVGSICQQTHNLLPVAVRCSALQCVAVRCRMLQ